jgi:hypothetical protein
MRWYVLARITERPRARLAPIAPQKRERKPLSMACASVRQMLANKPNLSYRLQPPPGHQYGMPDHVARMKPFS